MKFKSSAIIITFIKVIKVPNVIEIERVGEQRKGFLKMIMTTRMLARMIKDARNEKLESYRIFIQNYKFNCFLISRMAKYFTPNDTR